MKIMQLMQIGFSYDAVMELEEEQVDRILALQAAITEEQQHRAEASARRR
jgi:hypothetical protein